MPYVTVYYQGHKVQFVPLHDSSFANNTWVVEQNGERFKVREFRGEIVGTYRYDLYVTDVNGQWRFREQDITSLDGVARVVCDTVYV
jgi:hypothetical protein